MHLTKLLMKDFGKFHNKDINLKKGLNIIYGGDGSGKTTIRDFLVAMMYGIDRMTGISRVRSDYEKRKPSDRSGYSGTAYMQKDDSNYLVERTFLSGARKTSVLDVGSGRELRLDNSDSLVGTLVETGRNSYVDTRCISIEEDENDPDKAAEKLKSYLSNITLTGSTDINKQKAIEYLQNEKSQHLPKPLIRRLDELTKRLEEYDDVEDKMKEIDAELRKLDEDFVIEAEKRKRVARRLVENEDGTITYQKDEGVDDTMNRLTESRGSYSVFDDEDEVPEKLTDKMPVIIGTGLLVILVIGLIVYMLPFERMIRNIFIGVTALYVVITIIDGMRIKGYFDDDDGDGTPTDEDFKKVLEELQDENEKKEEQEFDMTFAREYQEKKDALKLREKEQIDRRGARARLKAEFDSVFKKKSELEDEMKAIDLAIVRINTLSEKYKKEAYQNFLIYVSEMIPLLTGGRYTELDFDERGDIIIKGDGGYFNLKDLPVEVIRSITLAVRLAVSKHLTREPLPLVIDGLDCSDDAERVALIRCLASMKEEQIIVLTKDLDFGPVVASLGLKMNYIGI